MTPKYIKKESNCIPTPAGCVKWDAGNIEFLGICDGDFLPKIIWEIVAKLEDVAGEDISQFDLDSVLEICNTKAPKEITLISILTVLRDTEVCLYEYIQTLEETIASLSSASNVSVSLKCYADFDTQGNSLGVTRQQLDQLVIDKLCDQKLRIEVLEGKVESIQEELDSFVSNPIVSEPEFTSCVSVTAAPTSEHVKILADDVCELQADLGTTDEAALITGAIPSNWNTQGFTDTLTKYDLADKGFIGEPVNVYQQLKDAMIAIDLLQKQVAQILSTCCAPTCDKIKIGFTGTFDNENSSVTLNFTRGAGTFIPDGFEDIGSTIVITDRNGVSVTVLTTEDNGIEMDGTIEDIDITGLASGKLLVSIKTSFGLKDINDTIIMTCQDCISGELDYLNSACCAITNTGETNVTLTIKTCSS